jgi:hypothetical protein
VGVRIDGQEDAIKEIKQLSPKAKGVISHHICNSLQAILTEAQVHGLKLSEGCVYHILEDLELFGIRENV